MQLSRAEGEGVPLLRRHQGLPPPAGDFRIGMERSLRHQLPVVVDVDAVLITVVLNIGVEAETDPIGPGHGHSEDACNDMLTRE